MAADPDFEEPSPKPAPRRSNRLIEWLAAIALLFVLIALLLPATRSAGEAARRSQCVNNLKQIALALHNYKDAYGAFPPAWTADASGRPLHSWRTLILPFLEQKALYETIDLAKPWDDPANAKALQAVPMTYRCPSMKAPPNATAYLAIVGPRSGFLPDRGRKLAEITNDRGATLMIIEAPEDATVPWMAPRDADEALVLAIGPKSRVEHSGGMNAAHVDGSVRFLKANSPAEERREMMAISGREKNDDEDSPQPPK